MRVFPQHLDQGRPRGRWLPVGAALVALLLAIGGALWALGRSTDPSPSITAGQRHMIEVLESVLLHNTPSRLYGWIADPHDGRGYVAGIGDFTTADGGILDVVAEYGTQAPDNPLTMTYLPILRSLAAQVSPSVRTCPVSRQRGKKPARSRPSARRRIS
jgi:Glycosyl hydrolase family 46